MDRKSNRKLRLCLDPKPLSKALKRPIYPIPLVDDLLPRLGKAKVFTVCDAKNGFWQLELDEPSSHLTTMVTPFGRYRWCRLPFGLPASPELLQEKLDRAIEGLGLEGIFAIFVILIIGEGDTMEEAEKCMMSD